ncbi:MAG TPA: hypothetical protein VMW75_17400 [Thermoanaerobaculia bacterium]|nr:hypothetical protein [Thermoanaerobaculia bacterium]
MKKTGKKLSLNRDTLRSLMTTPALAEAAGAVLTNVTCSCQVNCLGTGSCGCPTATCPTLCGQWYC